jgi:RNA polymerase sigma factor (sigma-70 family)
MKTTLKKSGFTKEEKNIIANENMKLIYDAAHRFNRTTGFDYDELFEVAQEAFCKALNSYDSSSNAKFTTYAVASMNNDLKYYIRGKKLENSYTHISMSDLENDDSENNCANFDNLLYSKMVEEGKDGSKVEDEIQKLEIESYFRERFKKMNKKSVQILILHYGLFQTPEHTQEEIAIKLNLSQGQVSKIEKRALDEFGRMAFLDYCEAKRGKRPSVGNRVTKL